MKEAVAASRLVGGRAALTVATQRVFATRDRHPVPPAATPAHNDAKLLAPCSGAA